MVYFLCYIYIINRIYLSLKANGFLSARGLAGGIPSAYTGLATAFLNSAQRLGQLDRLSIFEYQQPGWTYHGKGLWLTLPGQNMPHLTLIGSSNFGTIIFQMTKMENFINIVHFQYIFIYDI